MTFVYICQIRSQSSVVQDISRYHSPGSMLKGTIQRSKWDTLPLCCRGERVLALSWSKTHCWATFEMQEFADVLVLAVHSWNLNNLSCWGRISSSPSALLRGIPRFHILCPESAARWRQKVVTVAASEFGDVVLSQTLSSQSADLLRHHKCCQSIYCNQAIMDEKWWEISIIPTCHNSI